MWVMKLALENDLKKKKKFEKWIIPNAFMDAGYF